MLTPVHAASEVFEGIQQTKAGAPDFHTNFFPVQPKVQAWIEHRELFRVTRDGAVFFLRRDRDFWHLYCCAGSAAALRAELPTLPELKSERVVTDLVGPEAAVKELQAAFGAAGFRPYTRLQRMARVAGPEKGAPPAEVRVSLAQPQEGPGMLGLLESAFDRYGEQLPLLYEIEAALRQQQILAAKRANDLAGLLFFESQGFTSTLRFWAVAEAFRSLRIGSALMLHYFQTQPAVRRFVLWVNSGNNNAIQKYGHYGYHADGLIDQVMANEMIPA